MENNKSHMITFIALIIIQTKKYIIILAQMYGDREGPSSVYLVLSWPRHINSWERDIMSWPRDRFVEVMTSLCCGLELLC